MTCLLRVYVIQGVEVDKDGNVSVDEYQHTSAEGVYALGDVCGKAMLTPGYHTHSHFILKNFFNVGQDIFLIYQ